MSIFKKSVQLEDGTITHPRFNQYSANFFYIEKSVAANHRQLENTEIGLVLMSNGLIKAIDEKGITIETYG